MCEYAIWTTIATILFVISAIVMPFFFKEHFAGFIIGPIVSVFITSFMTSDNISKRLIDGPTFICKFNVTGYDRPKGRSSLVTTLGYYHIGKSKFENGVSINDKFPQVEWVYVQYNFVCKTMLHLYREKATDEEIDKIRDFAFVENNTLYTYHDYSMLQPDLVYYQVGYNLVYKAIRDNIKTKDSITNIRFIDINGDIQTLTESVKGYTSVPDTFLVFRNINENIDDRFIIAAPEVNTPENWAKISDYGFIFHYDVYSKEEIEGQCPQIREYVEKYKERMMAK